MGSLRHGLPAAVLLSLAWTSVGCGGASSSPAPPPPVADFALALRVGQDFVAAPMKVAAKLGVTFKEIDKLCAAVLNTLKNGALDPEGAYTR